MLIPKLDYFKIKFNWVTWKILVLLRGGTSFIVFPRNCMTDMCCESLEAGCLKFKKASLLGHNENHCPYPSFITYMFWALRSGVLKKYFYDRFTKLMAFDEGQYSVDCVAIWKHFPQIQISSVINDFHFGIKKHPFRFQKEIRNETVRTHAHKGYEFYGNNRLYLSHRSFSLINRNIASK